MSERDTHFQGFAKLLWDELVRANEYHYIDVNTDDDGVDPTNYRLIIAQRAYDLVWHTIHAIGLDHDSIPFQDIYRPEEDIPDLTKWPNHS